MKLGLLVPRYGTEVVGGTEHWLRTLCEQLVARQGWEAEVFTTCAVSAETWANEYPPGESVIDNVTVHRYPSLSGRDARYLAMYDAVRADPEAIPDVVARRFVDLVGPVCPDAIEGAEASDCDLIAVTPYLYWTSVHGVARLGRRAVLHGAAHDEPELHLPIMRAVFESVGGLAYNSHAERRLVERTFPIAALPSRVIGIAVVKGTGDPVAARATLGLGAHEPFVLCLGRVERGKGAHLLAKLWDLYRARRPGAPRLVFVGPVHEALEASDGVVVAGRQPEPIKWGALEGCDFLITPSAWESFSLVVLEAWLAGKAVLVNGRCESTVEHCDRSGGGVWFDQYGDFEVAVDRLLSDAGLRARMASKGEAYAQREFSWPVVTERYSELATRVRSTWSARSIR